MLIAYRSASAVLVVAASLSWPTAASALTDLVLNVDCASGSRIGQALNRPTLVDRRLVVVVNGTCTENVTIERDDVALRAGSSGGGVAAADSTKPAILVNGARRVLLENLVVTGGRDGIRITAGGAAEIRGGAVRNAAFFGVLANNGASATVDGSVVEGHGQYGIGANGATVSVLRSTLSNNNFSGAVAASGGALTLGQVDDAGNVCCGNTIENNRLDGVTVARAASARLYGNTIRGNGVATARWGLLVVEESMAWMEGGNVLTGNGRPGLPPQANGGGAFVRASTLRTGAGDQPAIPSSNEISGNVFGIVTNTANLELRGGLIISGNTFNGINLDQGSRLRTDASSITGNGSSGIQASQGSGTVFVGNANVISGNGQFGLNCIDAGTHFAGNTSGVTGNGFGQVNCSPF
jgi:Right handed beta helix region